MVPRNIKNTTIIIGGRLNTEAAMVLGFRFRLLGVHTPLFRARLRVFLTFKWYLYPASFMTPSDVLMLQSSRYTGAVITKILHVGGFKSRRVPTLAGTFSCLKKLISGKREGVSLLHSMKNRRASSGNVEPYALQKKKRHTYQGEEGTTPVTTDCPEDRRG